MGMSASQARFLQLTARCSNLEYEAQQVNFARLQLSSDLSDASTKYNDKTSNRIYQFSFYGGDGKETVDITYSNYKNYMNKQNKDIGTISTQQYFLVSSSGKKIIVSSEEEMMDIINDENNIDPETGKSKFTTADFMIVEDLDNQENFQKCIEDGTYYFATLENETYIDDDGNTQTRNKFNTSDISSITAISDTLDTSDDKEAETEYEKIKTDVQKKDKALEMRLDQLETERTALTTEMEALEKVIDDNIESSFKTFS